MRKDVEDTVSSGRDRMKENPTAGKSNANQQEMQKKMEAAGAPGPGHKALDALVGNWEAEVKCWMEPGGPPQLSRATAKAGWILNGRFLEEEFHGEMMGEPFTGRTLMGFDNVKQAFNSVWVSDMQTSMFTSEGKGDQGNKVITLEGKSTCAATGRTDIPMKAVYRMTNRDKHAFEMFDGSKGGNVKVMEITYTRK